MKRNERLSAKDRRLLKETLKELNRQGRLQEEKLAKQHGSTSVYQHKCGIPESLACRQASAADRPQGTGARGAFA